VETETVTYTIEFEQAPHGDWNALVPDLPGLLLVGDTREAILADAPDVILDYLDALREDGITPPRPTPRSSAVTDAAEVRVTIPAA
jgi:predicted RNase H-like HicB family nuclease